MIELYAAWNELTVKNRERMTSGSVQVNKIHVDFSPDWDGLDKVAIFREGVTRVGPAQALDENGECYIPWEAMTKHDVTLWVGISGTDTGSPPRLNTVYAPLGVIQEGASLDASVDPTPTVYEQLLAAIGDLDDLKTVDRSSLVAAINEARVTGGGGGLETDKSLTFANGVLSVNTTDKVEEDNTLPITSAAVAATVGNINELLKLI